MAGYAALFAQVPFLSDEVYEVEQRLVLDHHSLGLAGGTGGVYHISKCLWSGRTQFA